MREIREVIFRGKRLHDNKWIYGNFVSDCEGNPHIIEPRFFCEDGHHLQYEDNTDTPVFIIPETVGQFTGLTDKNGRKVFEGDILRGFEYPFCSNGEFNYFAEIVWFDDSSAFGIYTFKNPKSNVRGISEGNTDYLEYFNVDKWEVIGNIHDNPELLEGGEGNG